MERSGSSLDMLFILIFQMLHYLPVQGAATRRRHRPWCGAQLVQKSSSAPLWICVHRYRSHLNTNVAKLEWTNAGHLTLGGLFAPVRQPKYLPVIVDDTPGFIALNGFDGEAGLCGGRGDGIAKLRGENWAIYLGHCRLNSVSYNTTALICKRSKMEE